MSMRLGTSMTLRTRPRCLRMRKLDWMTLAIGAPDVFVDNGALGAWRFVHSADHRGTKYSYGEAGCADRPGLSLQGAVDLSPKLSGVKQKARRRRKRSLPRRKNCANG